MINKDPSTTFGEFDDVSKVEKYVMDQSEYEKKTGEKIVASFMKCKQKLNCNSLFVFNRFCLGFQEAKQAWSFWQS